MTVFLESQQVKCTIAFHIKLFKDYLEKLLLFTEAEIKAGKTKDEFIKNTAIPGVTEWKGDGIDRPLTAAYDELTAGK